MKMLSDNEIDYHELFVEIPEECIVTDLEGRIIKINKAMKNSGHNQPNIGTDIMYRNYAGFHKKDMYSELMDSIKTGKTKKFKELEYGNKYLDITIAPFAKGAIIVSRDVTVEKKAVEGSLKAQKLESLEFLAKGLAHDLNNLIGSIGSTNEMIKAAVKERDYSSVADILKMQREAYNQARYLTAQLMIFNRENASEKTLESLTDMLNSTTELMLKGRSNITVHYDIPKDIPPIEIDSGKMKQVWNNLIINSAQAMPDGGNIYIKARKTMLAKNMHTHPGEYVRIDIRDEGTGIPEEKLSRIFDLYFTTKEKGSGLGLAVSKSVIESHKGHIEVQSELNKGTTFSIYLPILDKI